MMIHPLRARRARRDAAERAVAARVAATILASTRPARVAADPGNPGRTLRLEPVPGGQVLVGQDATTGDSVRIPVPADITDPLAAAAWTFDDPTHPVRCTPATYATTERAT
jgi:hypothetical protein